MAEETIPISRATARSDSPEAPSVASCRRAISVISLISSARTRSRAVRPAFMGASLAEHCSPYESIARTSPRATHDHGRSPRRKRRRKRSAITQARAWGARASGLGPAVHGEPGEQFPDLARDPLDGLLVLLQRGGHRLVHPGGDLRHVLFTQPARGDRG